MDQTSFISRAKVILQLKSKLEHKFIVDKKHNHN